MKSLPFGMFRCFVILVSICGSVYAAVRARDSVSTKSGVLNYEEDWGYVDVKVGGRMFWWLYAVKPANERPLILWLQGGPGGSGTGHGNFFEIGPKDAYNKDRKHTWLQVADLVFVDSPVGSGFSYVQNDTAYTTNVEEIAGDLLVWLKSFHKKYPEYKSRPFFVFGQSYGGKVATEFARLLNEEKSNSYEINFQGIALGNSWISPMDFVNSWGPFLRSLAFLDELDYNRVKANAASCQTFVDKNAWEEAYGCYPKAATTIYYATNGVSFYNILKKYKADPWATTLAKMSHTHDLGFYYARPAGGELDEHMEGSIRSKLRDIPAHVRFGGQSKVTFKKQSGDFMRPVVDTVDQLLKDNTNVTVYNGNLDLICCSAGVDAWMSRLQWEGMANFNQIGKVPFPVNDGRETGGFIKKYKNLQLWTLLRGGHNAPHEAADAGLHMVQKIVRGY